MDQLQNLGLSDMEHISLCETLDRVLNKGVVVAGEVMISVANIDLIYLGLQIGDRMVTLTVSQEKIPCAFCHGRGTDPYSQLSELSQCAVCQGEGLVTVPVPHVTCVYCHGSGSHKTFTCPVCEGTGVIEPLSGPTCVCPDCDGLGYDASSGLNCLRCRGRGHVAAEGHSE